MSKIHHRFLHWANQSFEYPKNEKTRVAIVMGLLVFTMASLALTVVYLNLQGYVEPARPMAMAQYCEVLGGDYCGEGGTCPAGFTSLGYSGDPCNPCCKTATYSCSAKGGNYCSQSGSCPSGYQNLGNSTDCTPCCKTASLPTCSAMGGNYCSKTGTCPSGYRNFGNSSDCTPCCKSTTSGSATLGYGSCGAGNQAKFISQNVPTSMIAGQSYSVSVTMGNCGTVSWTPGGTNPFRLGSQNPQDNLYWGIGRVDVPTTVDPGQTHTFNFTVKTNLIGPKNFQWKMLQEGKAWFGQLTPNVVVNLSKPAPVTYSIGPGTSVTVEGSGINVSLESVESVPPDTGVATAWLKATGQVRQVVVPMRPGSVIHFPVGTVRLNTVTDTSDLAQAIRNGLQQSSGFQQFASGDTCNVRWVTGEIVLDNPEACVKQQCENTIGWDACMSCLNENIRGIVRESTFMGNLLNDWLEEHNMTRFTGELDLYLTLSNLPVTMSNAIMSAFEDSLDRMNDSYEALGSCLGWD